MISFDHQAELPTNSFNETEISSWIEEACKKEGKLLGDVSILFCSDEHLLKVNQDFLQHDYYTDIITFDYGNKKKISGDLLISIDRVIDNAAQNRALFIKELNRVIIHGILHLIGYKDKEPEDKSLMTSKEDYYLSLR